METSKANPDASPPRKPALLGRKRAAFQWMTTLAVIGVPFVRLGDNSLLRLDFGSLNLHAFGRSFPITDLSLFLLLTIALTLLFLLVTLAFGRAWCGWTCPQTTLVDLVEWLARRLGVKVVAGEMRASAGQKVLLQGAYLAIALLVGANLVWYFVAPYDFFPQLARGELHWAATLTLAVVAVVTYLDLALLRRLFCKEFCPYGRFQTVLIDPGTLVLHYHPDEAPRCIRCGACVRACPTGIDIRRGYQVECINCGRCLDACREVMARRGEAGIIRYTFGLEGKGLPALLNLRMALVALALLGVCAGMLTAVVQRDQISLKIGRNASLLPRSLDESRVANFYSAYLTNRTDRPLRVHLALPETAAGLSLSGAGQFQTLEAHEKRRVDFAVLADKETLAEPRPVDILVISAGNDILSTASVYLTGVLDEH